MAVPNQKIIYIERSSDNAKKDFLKVSNTNLRIAMMNLSPNAFKLWIYFVDNADGYKMDLYPCDFQRVANVSYDTYRRCFDELVTVGFLIASPKAKNIYIFSETSEKLVDDLIGSVGKESLDEIRKNYFD